MPMFRIVLSLGLWTLGCSDLRLTEEIIDRDVSASCPGVEVCDGLDNDRDISTADGSDEHGSHSPFDGDDGDDGDSCREGSLVCVSGRYLCSDASSNTVEACDGIDNDCNPDTPDGSGEPWFEAPCDGLDEDLCEEGVMLCIQGEMVCSDESGPNIELCDQIDNDCDGHIDEGTTCSLPPVAVCTGTSLDAVPLQTLTFDGTASFDPDNDSLTYAWRLVLQPSGSKTQLDSEDGPLTDLFIDLAGSYQIELTVSDGVSSDACIYNVLATPDAELHVQLIWNSEFGDIDLHLTAANAVPNGAFFSDDQDNWYRYPSKPWPPSGPANNAGLDIDDTAGWGPENINIFTAPVLGGTYHVGVHQFCGQSLSNTGETSGPSLYWQHEVRVKIYCHGILAASLPGPDSWYLLEELGTLWVPASVTWNGDSPCTVTPVGTVSSGLKHCVETGECQKINKKKAVDCLGVLRSLSGCKSDAECRGFEFCDYQNGCILNDACASDSDCRDEGYTCDLRYSLCSR